MVTEKDMIEFQFPPDTKAVNILLKNLVIGIKGAGEMATGLACRLYQANLRNVFMMETAHPLAVRRRVSFCEAVFDDTIIVEGITARKASNKNQVHTAWQNDEIPVIVDPSWTTIDSIRPHVVIDAIIAKKNIGTTMSDAPLVIGLGPGFDADKDVHLVIETNRGHNMGRVIQNGTAESNTGVPGNIGGKTVERVLRAPCDGIFHTKLYIGDFVNEEQVIGFVDDAPVISKINGLLRGLIRKQSWVRKGQKIGDVDPRGETSYQDTVSEKARSIGGAVLEAIMQKLNK